MIQGLYHTLDDLNHARAVALNAACMEANPQDAHDARLRAVDIERQIRQTQIHIDEDIDLLEPMENLIDQINASPVKSAHRTLVLRHIEDAHSRILRELGDYPATVI